MDDRADATASYACAAVRNASRVHPNDNFPRITVEPRRLVVEFYERKGDRLGRPKAHAL